MCTMVDINGIKVAECKRDFLQLLIQYIKSIPEFKALIVFGPVISNYCELKSNIEYAVIGSLSWEEGSDIVEDIRIKCMDFDFSQFTSAEYYNESEYSINEIIHSNSILGGGAVIWSR